MVLWKQIMQCPRKRFSIQNQRPLKQRVPVTSKGLLYNHWHTSTYIFTTSNIFHFRRARQRSRKDRRTPRNFQAFKDAAAADKRRAVDDASSSLPDVRWRHTSRPPTKNVDDGDAGKSSKVKKRHIVFLKDSPDYCLASSSSKIGSHQGVLGRKCSADPNSPNPEAGVKKCSKLCRSCGLKVVNCKN